MGLLRVNLWTCTLVPVEEGEVRLCVLLVWAKLELLCLHGEVLHARMYASFLVMLHSREACVRDVEGRGEQSGQGSFPGGG